MQVYRPKTYDISPEYAINRLTKQPLFANHLKKLSLFMIMSLFLEVELTQPPNKNYQKLGAPKMAAGSGSGDIEVCKTFLQILKEGQCKLPLLSLADTVRISELTCGLQVTTVKKLKTKGFAENLDDNHG